MLSVLQLVNEFPFLFLLSSIFQKSSIIIIKINKGCVCNSGYTGDGITCTTIPCSPNPCQNGGTCSSEDGTSFSCNCAGTGFNGLTCNNNIDDCSPNPCLNGGTCIDGINCKIFLFC